MATRRAASGSPHCYGDRSDAQAREFIVRRDKVGPPINVKALRENLGTFAHRDVFVEGILKAGVPE